MYRVAAMIYGVTPLAHRRAQEAMAGMRAGNAEAAAIHVAAYRRYVDAHLKILAGPFAGMSYIGGSCGSLLGPKLIGSYEAEIAPWVSRAIDQAPPRIVDIGCAEGYYAVGFAWRCPSTRIFAFDSDAEARQNCSQLASLNGVSNRIKIMGRCDIDGLRSCIRPETLILCDIEGAERKLLNLRRISALRHAAMIVETHDHAAPGTTDLLVRRFRKTHEIEILSARPRSIADFASLRNFPSELRPSLLSEGRPADQRWLRLTPRVAHASL